MARLFRLDGAVAADFSMNDAGPAEIHRRTATEQDLLSPVAIWFAYHSTCVAPMTTEDYCDAADSSSAQIWLTAQAAS